MCVLWMCANSVFLSVVLGIFCILLLEYMTLNKRGGGGELFINDFRKLLKV